MILFLKICTVFIVMTAIIAMAVVIEKLFYMSVLWSFGFWSYPILMGIINYKPKGDTK